MSEINKEYEAGKKDGLVRGLGLAAELVMEFAKLKFSQGKDDEASFLRSIAEKINDVKEARKPNTP